MLTNCILRGHVGRQYPFIVVMDVLIMCLMTLNKCVPFNFTHPYQADRIVVAKAVAYSSMIIGQVFLCVIHTRVGKRIRT